VESSLYWRVNKPTIISEIIEDEAIIINLDSGAYYSLRGGSVMVWKVIQLGGGRDQVIDQLTHAYQGEAEAIAASAMELLAELENEQIIVAADAESARSFDAKTLPFDLEGERPLCAPLVVDKYTDMKDLLLADPIHDVDDDFGWPTPKAPQQSTSEQGPMPKN
jgi:hypothetical protein